MDKMEDGLQNESAGNRSKISTFRYTLHRFLDHKQRKASAQFELNLSANAFIELTSDQVLQIEILPNQEKGQTTDPLPAKCLQQKEICSFSCCDNTNTPRNGERESEIAVTSTQHWLCIYKLLHSGLHNVCDADLGIILKDVIPNNGIKSSSVVYFNAGNVYVLINKTSLVHIVLKDGQFTLGSSVSVPETDGEPFQILQDVCVVLDTHYSKLSFHRLPDLVCISELDLSMLNIDLSSTQKWCLPQVLDKLALVTQAGHVQIVDLQQLCVNSPSLLSYKNTSNTGAGSLVTSRQAGIATSIAKDTPFLTCHYGDMAWKNKLLHLHSTALSPSQSTSSTVSTMPPHLRPGTGKQSFYKKTRVTGFQAKKHRKQQQSQSAKAVTVICALEGVSGYSVEATCFDQGRVTLVYSYNDAQVLCQLYLRDKSWIQVRLSKEERVMLSHVPSLPHMVVMDTHIDAMVTARDMDQEQLVSELMVYGGATLADAVCLMNNWGRCSLPIHTLEVGLKYRQLDTVTYFLKSKENLFSTNASPSEFGHYDSLIHLDSAIALLLETVRSTMTDKHSQIFGKQVLDASLDFLYGLLLDGLTVLESATNASEKRDLKQATDKLLLYIEDTRKCVRSMEEHTSSLALHSEKASLASSSGTGVRESRDFTDGQVAEMECAGDELDDDQPELYKYWDMMSTQNVIENGILENKIPELQQYLLQREEPARADYSRLKATGCEAAIAYIKSHNMVRAKEILQKLGLSVSQELWQVALYTLDRTLCSSITEELLLQDSLTGEQIAMVTFLNELNDLYPCTNFEEQQGLHHHVKDCGIHKVQRLKSLIHTEGQYDLATDCGNLATQVKVTDSDQGQGSMESQVPGEGQASTEVKVTNTEKGQGSTGYNEIMLAWVQNWDSETRDRIKLDVLFHRPGSDVNIFSKEIIWDYLVSRNMLDVTVAWIHNSFPSNQSGLHSNQTHSNRLNSDSSKLDNQDLQPDVHNQADVGDNETSLHSNQNNALSNNSDVLSNQSSLHSNQACESEVDTTWPVSQLGDVPRECVNRTECCTRLMKDSILKAFASHGVFNDEDMVDFTSLLQRLNTIGGPLQVPHPLVNCGAQVLKQFHVNMVQYCIDRNLPYFLWSYCTQHRLSMELLHLALEDLSVAWLPLFLSFYSITLQTDTLKQSMHGSSLINAASVWGEEISNVGELIKGDHPLAAMATLMYSPHRLHQVTFVTQQLEEFDGLSSETVQQALQAYPKLQVSLFPASASDSPHTDVSMYQLLIGNAPFDPSKLFGWQSTNSCTGEDAMKDLPYFSHPDLVSQHGYSEQLRYTYYLRQGRPSFAFITFLAEEFKNGGPTIPSKRLAIAIGTSLWIGVKHFHSGQIASSCVVFQELLGHDSLMLRTYIHVGSQILTHRHNAVTGTMDKRREQLRKNEQLVVEMLLDCVQDSRQYAQEVKHSLEAAILAGITRDRLPLCSYEAAERWTLAVLFCHLLHLPYTTEFLESCAQTNQWLPFVWFAQLHQYPKDKLLNLLHKFKSHHLQEHLRYVLANADMRSTQAEQKKGVAGRRTDGAGGKDMRSSLYKKIGVVKQAGSDGSSTSDDEDEHGVLGVAMDTTLTLTEDEADGLVTVENSADDVFGVIFSAQASKFPWKTLLMYSVRLRNCLFSELAACQQGADVVPCLCSWLVSMMDAAQHAHFLQRHAGKSPWQYSMQVLDDVIDEFVRCKWGSILVTGLDIFQQNSPLLLFLQFYSEFIEKQNYKNCRLLLEEFKESIFQFHHERGVEPGAEQIGDSNWLEQTTYRIIQYMLTHIPSVYQVHQLLKILDSESITLVFTEVDADFRRQCQLLDCITLAKINTVDLSALLGPNADACRRECRSVIGRMVERGVYDVTRRFSKLCEENADHITVTQVQAEKQRLSDTELWSSNNARVRFYENCCEKFIQHSVSMDTIAKFYQAEADMSSCHREKACLYKLALHCIVTGDSGGENTAVLDDLYRNMWINRIQERLHAKQNPEVPSADRDIFEEQPSVCMSVVTSAKKELLYYGKMPKSSDISSDLNDKEIEVLQELIGELLDGGEISETCRLTSMFTVYSQDLAIILTCIRLSLASESLETLSADMLHLLRSKAGNVHRQSIAAPVALLRNSSTISLMSNIQPVIDTVNMESEAKIAAMEILLNHCKAGRQTCVRILTASKIATVLCIGYDDVIAGEDYHILRSLLKTSCQAKFRLAGDFLATSSLSLEQVAGFLSDAILQSYRVSLGEVIAGDQQLFFDPSDSSTDFHQVVRLCREPSLLGNRLVDAVASMDAGLEHTSDKVLTLQTEVLILAHECYTASCDMEGISNILRAARILTSHLEAASEYQLMTRLLTGVGRYNEMTYIFDALHQSHQFELLLGKGTEKEIKIKTAILDYLKRYRPGDTELYTMVALKFLMYREIAQLLEDNANKQLEKLNKKPLENSPETQQALQKITQFLSEAAESYIKDRCLRHAQTCIRKARLVSLQQKHLSANQQFINLTRKGVSLLIADHPVFTEAYIISEAYHQKENWALALCNNYINLGNAKYLQDFRTHLKLTPHLIEDAVDRYQQCKEKSPQAPANIRKLLQLCKDVKIQYRIAKQLALRDVVTSLEKGDAKSYIIDFSSSAAGV